MDHALHNASAGHLRGMIRVLERHVAGKYVSFVLIDSRSLESPSSCWWTGGGSHSKVFCLCHACLPIILVNTSHPSVRSHTRLDRYKLPYTSKYRNSVAANTAGFPCQPRPALNPLTEIGCAVHCDFQTTSCSRTFIVTAFLPRHGK